MVLRSVSLYGLLIAILGFLLTRFTVTLAAYSDSTQFLFAGIVPLVIGLLLAAFGVVLAVGPFDRRFVRQTAIWTLLGTASMLVLVVLTLLGSDTGSDGLSEALAQTYLSNFLIGGSIGGLITGMYSANNLRHRQDLKQQSNRLILLNRILREEVVNAVTVIRGHVDFLGDRDGTRDIIDEHADRIATTVDDVKSLTPTARAQKTALTSIDAVALLENAIATVRARYPDAVFSVTGAETAPVWATENLEAVFEQLLDNAVRYAPTDAPVVDVDLETVGRRLNVAITDQGPGVPKKQRALLEDGVIAEYDDPSAGFGLNVVRLLVESYHGAIDVEPGPSGTTVTVSVPSANTDHPPHSLITVSGYGASLSELGVAVVAGIIGGIVMGYAMQSIAGVLPIIGALYGVQDPLVGWITHEFHSVVFALMFMAILNELPATFRHRLWWCVGVALVWATLLAVFAAGLVMPFWLDLVGFPAMLPNFSAPALSTHLLWGLVVGVVVHVGNRALGPGDESPGE